MIKMSELIKQQNDMIRKESGMNVKEENLKEDSLGDVNLDGNLNVLDAVMLAAYVLGNTDLSNESLLNADMNQDEIVDILDVVILINIILGNE